MKTPPSISDLQRLERQLLEQRERVEAELETLLGRSEDECHLHLKEEVFGPDEEAMLARLDAGFRAQFLQLRTDLAAIDAALARHAVKTYGICAACGRPISADRLRSHPVAVQCETCDPIGVTPRESKVA